MESKKANLLIDISKNVLKQYRDQLEQSIEESKQRDTDAYDYENHVTRAEYALKLVDKILKNYDQSVFDGEISQDKTMRAYYNDTGRHYEEVQFMEGMTKEDREIAAAKWGIERIFEYVGLPEYTMYPIIADIITRFQDKNYKYGKIDESYARIRNKRFNEDGKYNVGRLQYNNTLTQHVAADTGVFIDRKSYDSKYLYCSGIMDFIIDSLPICDVVDEYVKNEFNENSISDLDSQNNKVKEIMNFIKTLKPISADSREEYSYYYYDFFKNLEYNDIEKYFTVARNIESKNNELKDLENIKNKLTKLSDLTNEEKDLINRLLEIQNEKAQIISLVNDIKKDEKLGSTLSNENPERTYINENHYIENGVHYHLPQFDDETHIQLK